VYTRQRARTRFLYCIFIRENVCGLQSICTYIYIYIYIYICKFLISIACYQDSSCLSYRSNNSVTNPGYVIIPGSVFCFCRIYRARLDSLLEQIAGYPRPGCHSTFAFSSGMRVALNRREAQQFRCSAWRLSISRRIRLVFRMF